MFFFNALVVIMMQFSTIFEDCQEHSDFVTHLYDLRLKSVVISLSKRM